MLFTARTGKFNYGVGLDYKVADMSRQRDPRSRSYLLDYKLVPSITYNIDKKNIIGLNLSYRMEKEKMPNLTTVQTDPNLKYYDFRGLNYADGKIGGYKGFQRQFVSDFFGLAGQYNYIGVSSKFLLSVGMDYQKQEVLGNKKQSPGSYNSFNYSPLADNNIEQSYKTNVINKVLNGLSNKEHDIILLCYGFTGQEYTPELISPLFGCTPERIRQIRKEAIKKLRKRKILKNI
jgi:RNA polymerase sigma factor (sigma-70 family)